MNVVHRLSIHYFWWQVWDSNRPWLTDFVSIPVGYAVEPAQPRVNLGGIICFSTPVTSDQGKDVRDSSEKVEPQPVISKIVCSTFSKEALGVSFAVFGENLRYCYSLGAMVVVLLLKMFT